MMLLGSTGQTIDFIVRRGDGWNTSPILAQESTTLASTGAWELHFIDVSAAGISLVAGEVFVIETANGDSGINLQGHYDVLNPSYPEELFLGGPGCYSDCGWRIGFETFMLTGPSTPILSVTNLVAGGLATFDVSNATPAGVVRIGLSTTGGGPLNTPFGVAELSAPVISLPAIVANGSGDADISLTIPAGTSGTTLWMQALDLGTGTFSNGLQEVVL